MHHWHAMNVLMPRKNLKLLSNRNLCFIHNQSLTKPVGGCFDPSSQTTECQKSTKCFKHTQYTFSKCQHMLRILPARNFSLTKAVFSFRGSNRKKEEKELLILTVSLASALLLSIYLMATMEYHQDYVIIEPENKK